MLSTSPFSALGVDAALSQPDIEVRVFGKPTAKPYRRMAVALARAPTTAEARKRAARAASKIKVLEAL